MAEVKSAEAKSKSETHPAHHEPAASVHAEAPHNGASAHNAAHDFADPIDVPASHETRDMAIATAATVGVVAVGALVFEAALIPGLVLGAAAAVAPQFAPRLGAALNPLFRSTIRGAYRMGQKSREMFAEAQEHLSDIAAEVSAEEQAKPEAAQTEAPKKAAAAV